MRCLPLLVACLLAFAACAVPSEPIATARVCAIRPDTNALLAAPDTLREVVGVCTPNPRVR